MAWWAARGFLASAAELRAVVRNIRLWHLEGDIGRVGFGRKFTALRLLSLSRLFHNKANSFRDGWISENQLSARRPQIQPNRQQIRRGVLLKALRRIRGRSKLRLSFTAFLARR